MAQHIILKRTIKRMHIVLRAGLHDGITAELEFHVYSFTLQYFYNSENFETLTTIDKIFKQFQILKHYMIQCFGT